MGNVEKNRFLQLSVAFTEKLILDSKFHFPRFPTIT